MKASGVIVMVAGLVLLGASAVAAAPVRWGPRVGVNASAYSGEFADVVTPELRYFPNLGLVVQVDLARNLSFRGEAAYSVKGGGAASQGTDPSGNPTSIERDTWRFDYLEFPLLVRTRFPIPTGVTPYLEVGPSVGIALRGRFESKNPVFPSVDFRDDMKAVDLGFGGGLGVEIPAGTSRVGIEARYTRGFSDLFDLANNASMINQAWTFAVSWLK